MMKNMKYVAMILMVLTLGIGNVWGTAPATSADTPGASGTVTFEDWTSLTKEQNYWKDGIKFWPYANLTSISNGTFTTSVPVHGYNANITAGSGWGSYTMSGLTTYAHFALGVSVKSAALVEIVVDNNQNNDLTLTRLSIKKDDVAYAADYTGSNYTTGTDIKSKATITRLDAGTGHYKISIPVTSSDLASSDPYIIKLSAATWDDPCAFVFESVTVTTCTAPNHVDISGTNKYLGGQTISLTATAYSSAGTGSPIAAANITGYQWQKEINSVWTDVENGSGVSGATTNNLQISSCDHNNSGQYRCVVSTGATCSTNSGAYGVHVFSVYGGYVGEDWSDSEIEFSSGTTGSATVHLNAGSLYKFHIRSNDGAYYSNGVADYNGDGDADDTSDGWYVLKSVSGWSFGRSNKNFRIYAGPEGDYTITVDIANALVSGDYVTVDITYPTVTHPADGYVYFEKPNDWTNVYLYWYNDNNSRLTSWDGSPEITTTTSICGTTYYYTSLGTTFGNMIFKGNGTNQWKAISTSSCGGKYLDKTTYESPAWASFPTYTISFDGNGETSGSMSDIEDIDASTNQTITTNAFSKTGYTFAGWKADVDVKINGSTVSAGTVIANGATLQNICGDIELTAQWNVNSYDLTWNLGGGTTSSAGTGIASGVSANTTSSTAYGTSLSAPTVTKTGYEFAVWDPSVAGTMPAEATTYTATWTAQQYDISYKDQGHVDFTGIHENDKPSKHTYGSETTLKTAFKDGYVFGGWFGNSSCTGSALTSLGATDYTAKVYLYAKWTAMNLDALEGGTLYKVEDMVPAGVTIESGTPYYPGVSANNRFNIRGSSKLSDNATAGMCPRADVRTISGVEFTKVYGFRKPASGTDGTDLGTSLPDNHAIQFKISGDGLLDIYCYYADSIYLVKDGGSAIVLSASKSLQKVTKEVTAGTYYLYSTHVGSNQRLYGLKFTPTYTLTASATVINPMTEESQSGEISGATITNSPVSGIVSGTTTSTSSNTFTVAKATPVTVTAPTTVDSEEGECDGCTYRFDSWENIPATVTEDVSTIHAKYNTTYTISFKETDGTDVDGISSTYYVYGTDKDVDDYPTPTKSGYAFDGWYKEYTLTNEAEDIDDEVYGNITVYAKWTHSVTFHANGGSGSMSTMKGESSSATLTSNSFSKSGCTFYGWATSQANANAGTVAYADGATIDMSGSNYDLYAVWKLNKPSLSCFENVVSMTVPGGSTVYYTTAASGVKPSVPTSSNTAYNSSSKPTITKDTTFAAIAILANHVSSDTAVLYCTYDDAVSISLPATLDKSNVTDYSEMSWYGSSDEYFDFGPEDAVNTGRWAEWEVYLVPCEYNITTITTCSNGYGWKISINDTELSYSLPDLDGGTDVEWNNVDASASAWDLTSLSAGVYTIRVMNHRQWSQPKLLSLTLDATVYTVTYDANGGSCGTAREKVCPGDEVTLPSALGDGAFEGWYTSSDEEIGGTGDSYKPTADITLYAHWGASCPTPAAPTDFDLSSSTMTTATFSITDGGDAASYDLYYASGSPSTPTGETTATQSVTTKTPTITGLTASTEYKIWVRSVCDASHKSAWVALDAEGGAFTTPDPETYTITYNTDGAAEDQISDGEKTEGTNFTLSSSHYTKAGYWHVGWATSQGGSKVYDFGGTYSTDADLALYPAWVKLAVYEKSLCVTSLSELTAANTGRWTLTTGDTKVDLPSEFGGDVEENLTGDKCGLAFAESSSARARYDIGTQGKLYQMTITMISEKNNGSCCIQLVNASGSFAIDEANSQKYLTWPGSGDDWQKKTVVYTFPEGHNNVQKINIFGQGSNTLCLQSIKLECEPSKTYVVLDNQSATSAGTTSVTATYGASTNLTSDITAPTKTNYIFGGYYTEESGAGTQLIDENGAWLASKTDYTDGSKNWKYSNPDLTLYAKWTAKTTPTKYNVTAETIGSCNEASVTIILEDSEDGVTYELYKDGSATGTTKTGTGEALNWSGITAAGEYTIWTVEDETYASVQMDNDGYTTVTVIVKDDAELAYDDDEIEKNVGDAAFTNTLTNSHSVSVTYESSDEDVATVETDGEVTIVGAGSTTITASFAGDATYCAAEVSYTLTVYPVYTVTYIAMGGSCSPTSANTTTDLGKVTLPSASHDDYSSYTWVTSDGTEAGAAGDEYEPSGNITLYAKWSGSCASTCYTVTYHGNGATSGYVNDPVQYASGTTVYVSSSTGSYTRDGYEFNGWNTAANGSGTKVAYFSITGNTTLYAQWKYVINSNNTDFSGYAAAPTQYQDVKVTNGATLTITSTRTIHDLTIETGSTLNVSTTNGDGTGDGVTFTVNSLHLKGGWNSNYTKYDMPRVYIDRLSSLVKDAENPIVNFDISVDSRNYYPFALPFDVVLNTDENVVDYVNPLLASYSNYGPTGQYVIKEYDGERRAEKGPDQKNNWKVVAAGSTLKAGKGYILTAVSLPDYGGGVIRFPLSFTNAWTTEGEQGTIDDSYYKNVVPVTAWEGEATKDGKNANKGWNLLGVPFMSCYGTGAGMYDEDNVEDPASIIQGKFNFEDGTWDGEDKVRYVNVPVHDFSEYIQTDITDAGSVLRPGWCFFVQIETRGNLTFLTGDQAASSSLPIYAPKREKANMPIVKTGIILSDGEKSDKTTFLVSDKYSAMDYEINADLEKLFGNGYTLATYSLSGETRLAYNALSNADAANIIPIGYRAPAEGEYTFSINPSYAENGAFESVNLIDYETGIVTDLLVSSYTFDTERTQNDERFALNVVKAPQTATDITVTGDGLQVTGPQKVIINDKLYIIVDGRMYDAKGAMVK